MVESQLLSRVRGPCPLHGFGPRTLGRSPSLVSLRSLLVQLLQHDIYRRKSLLPFPSLLSKKSSFFLLSAVSGSESVLVVVQSDSATYNPVRVDVIGVGNGVVSSVRLQTSLVGCPRWLHPRHLYRLSCGSLLSPLQFPTVPYSYFSLFRASMWQRCSEEENFPSSPRYLRSLKSLKSLKNCPAEVDCRPWIPSRNSTVSSLDPPETLTPGRKWKRFFKHYDPIALAPIVFTPLFLPFQYFTEFYLVFVRFDKLPCALWVGRSFEYHM